MLPLLRRWKKCEGFDGLQHTVATDDAIQCSQNQQRGDPLQHVVDRRNLHFFFSTKEWFDRLFLIGASRLLLHCPSKQATIALKEDRR
jgi:hypothetical protein